MNIARWWSVRVVSDFARNHAIVLAAEIFVKVWIVSPANLDLTGSPAESRLALGAPHLVTPVNLKNHRRTLGTRASILIQKAGRLEICRQTHVIIVIRLDLVTLSTRLDTTKPTFPSGR
jgi:hypothetical protein